MRALLLTAAAALAGCQAAPVAAPGTSDAFAREIAGRVAGEPQLCVSTMPDQTVRVIDPRTVAYGFGSTIYVNRLEADCPALSSYNTIIVETAFGSQYCRGDRVRGIEPGATIPGPMCILRDWVPYRRP